MTVDPKLVTMFNAAAEQGRAGKAKAKQALAGYQAILDLQRKQKLAASPKFVATVRLQLSYTLIDLGKHAEAARALEAVDVDALGKERKYDFYFTKGNVLGALRQLKPMYAAFVEAISAAEDEDDYTVRPGACWKKILGVVYGAGDWAYLLQLSEIALNNAKLRGNTELEQVAFVAHAEAQKHLRK